MTIHLRACFAPLIGALLAGCGGGGSGESALPPPPPAATGLLVSGGSAGVGLATFQTRAQGLSPTSSRALLASTPTADATASAGFTGTYTLEANVDEHDILKYDGDLLVTAPTRSGCCFMFGDALPLLIDGPDISAPPTRAIRLFNTDPAAGTAASAGSIPLADDESIEGLYLTPGQLQALGSTAWWGTFGVAMLRAPLWQSQETRLRTWDISRPDQPAMLSDLRIEGALVASRRTGDEILIVTRHTPAIPGFMPYPQNAADMTANQAAVASLTAVDVLPEITRNGAPVDALRLDACYRQDAAHPLAAPAPEGATVTTLLTVSASTGAVLRANCVLEPVSGVYVSGSSIVLTWVDGSAGSPGTYVHLLRLRDHAYLGSERVLGQLYGGGNADFRISERAGVLRLVTTAFTGDETDRFDHRLFTLRASASAPELDVLATLPGPDGPELGKPNEDLYGVRFLDRRAYLVTFERIDPLYVIDLADPARPEIVGELEVPGFSDLLHPVSDDLLLGIGRSETNRVKAELYNISTPSSPQRAGVVELGSDYDGSYSPAQYNRYAFSYLSGAAQGSAPDRFTLPYSAWRIVDQTYQSKDAIALFEITGKSTPEAATLATVGEVQLPNGEIVSDQTRVVLDDNALYAWTGQSLLAGFWSNPEAVGLIGR